ALAAVMAVTKWSISGSEKSVPAKDQQSKRLRCAAAVALTRASALSRASATFFCETRLIARDYHLTLLPPMLGIALGSRLPPTAERPPERPLFATIRCLRFGVMLLCVKNRMLLCVKNRRECGRAHI